MRRKDFGGCGDLIVERIGPDTITEQEFTD